MTFNVPDVWLFHPLRSLLARLSFIPFTRSLCSRVRSHHVLIESHGTLMHLRVLISVILFVGYFRSCFNDTSPYKFHTSLIYLVARAQVRRYVVIITSISLQNAGYGSDTAGVSSWDQRASDRRYATSEFRTRVRGQGEYYLRMFMCLRL